MTTRWIPLLRPEERAAVTTAPRRSPVTPSAAVLRVICSLTAAALVLAAGGTAQSAPRHERPAADGKKRCKVVKKRVRGKVRRVRVCRTVRPRPRPPARPPAPPPPPPDAGGLHVTARISVEGRPNIGSLAVGEGSVWVRTAPDQVFRIDPAANRVTATIRVGRGRVGWVIVGEGAVWVSNYDANTVSRIDPRTNAVTATIGVGAAPTGLAITPGAVWVANHHANSVSRIDPASNQVVATIPVASSAPEVGPQTLAAAAGAVWLIANDTAVGPQLKKIDPATNAVSMVRRIGGGCAEIAAGATLWLWTEGCEAGAVSEVDPATGTTLGTVAVGAPGDSELDLGALWLANVAAEVVRVDPTSRAVTGRLRVAELSGVEPPVAVGDDAVWTAGFGVVIRVAP